MTNAHDVTLTASSIQRHIVRMNKIIKDIEYYRKYYRQSSDPRRKSRARLNIRKSMAEIYVMKCVQKANIKDGLMCFKCEEMITPGEECISRKRGNQLIRFPYHYHRRCYEGLFH